jgi:hypothetical protein
MNPRRIIPAKVMAAFRAIPRFSDFFFLLLFGKTLNKD